MAKPSKGKWFVRGGELCLDDGKAEPNCREVRMSGSKVEFRGTALEGVSAAAAKTRVNSAPRRLMPLKTALKQPS
jgi:hypothetical protein